MSQHFAFETFEKKLFIILLQMNAFIWSTYAIDYITNTTRHASFGSQPDGLNADYMLTCIGFVKWCEIPANMLFLLFYE